MDTALTDGSIEIIMTGDNAFQFGAYEAFDHVKDAFHRAEATIVHIETPYGEHHPLLPGHRPENIPALREAGVDIATLASNQTHPPGPEGIRQTIDGMRAVGVEPTGAGSNLDEARNPAIIERGGVRIGVIARNCVGPTRSWASPGLSGCAYVDVITHYRMDPAAERRLGHAAGIAAGGGPIVYTFVTPESLATLREDIQALRDQVDILAVVLHKGVVGQPAWLDMYERPLAQAAVDAGADLVAAHHTHTLRGIEVYRGKPIFHGLGVFALLFEHGTPELEDWISRRATTGDFIARPRTPLITSDPLDGNGAASGEMVNLEAKATMYAVIRASKSAGVTWAGYMPCWIGADGRPEPVGANERGQTVFEFVERVSRDVGFDTQFRWEGDLVGVDGVGPGPAPTAEVASASSER